MSVQQRDRVRLRRREWHLVEDGEAEVPRHLVTQSPVGPRGVPGPEEAVRPELCTRMGEAAQEGCVSQGHRRRRGLQGAPWSLQFLGHLCSKRSRSGFQEGPAVRTTRPLSDLGCASQPLCASGPFIPQ